MLSGQISSDVLRYKVKTILQLQQALTKVKKFQKAPSNRHCSQVAEAGVIMIVDNLKTKFILFNHHINELLEFQGAPGYRHSSMVARTGKLGLSINSSRSHLHISHQINYFIRLFKPSELQVTDIVPWQLNLAILGFHFFIKSLRIPCTGRENILNDHDWHSLTIQVGMFLIYCRNQTQCNSHYSTWFIFTFHTI